MMLVKGSKFILAALFWAAFLSSGHSQTVITLDDFTGGENLVLRGNVVSPGAGEISTEDLTPDPNLTIGGSRKVEISDIQASSTLRQCSAIIVVNSFDRGFVTSADVSTACTAKLTYDKGGTGLNEDFSGILSIDLNFRVVDNSSDVQVSISDGNKTASLRKTILDQRLEPTPKINQFEISQFTGIDDIDLSNIQSLEIAFLNSGTENLDIEISQIKATFSVPVTPKEVPVKRMGILFICIGVLGAYLIPFSTKLD